MNQSFFLCPAGHNKNNVVTRSLDEYVSMVFEEIFGTAANCQSFILMKLIGVNFEARIWKIVPYT